MTPYRNEEPTVVLHPGKVLLLIILLGILLFLTHCGSTGPVICLPNGTRVVPPISALENTTYEEYTFTSPQFSYTVRKVGKNQSLGLSQILLVSRFASILRAIWPGGAPSVVPQSVAGLAAGGVGGYVVGKQSAQPIIPPLKSNEPPAH